MSRAVRLAAVAVIVAFTSAAGVYFAAPDSAQSQRTDPRKALLERQVPQDREQIRLSFAPAVKKAQPAVVNIYVRQRRRVQRSPLFDDPFFRRFFGRDFGIPRRRAQRSLGSGVLVSADGLVVTNYHVIRGRDGRGTDNIDIKVSLADGREYQAEVILEDKQTDLAVLRLQNDDAEEFPHIRFADSDQLEVGDLVLAIGNPFGVGQTVTSGIVSATARTRVGITDYQFFIQTDAAINPGNSGGALVDTDGRLVGINTAIFTRSGGSQGIGFAIPSNMVRVVVESALQGGRVRRPWLGVSLQTVTSELAEGFGLPRPRGALIADIMPDSPAAEAGLEEGDVVLRIDGQQVRDAEALRYRIATKGLGETAEFEIWRNGARRTVRVDLQPPPENPPRKTTKLTGDHPFAGATVENLSPAVAQELRMRETSGVVVRETESYSPARRVGLRPGDVIVEINGARIERVRDLERAVQTRARIWRLAIQRNGEVLRTAIRWS
ncbi:DegQ family serine endoprotease [Dichotomicrobium thermohalophilum]|uniref:Do/DeqQ family serine protease n=1 Tax=Dichotomicrobium thermohalophilum TaxID=933063 RepID=A0A397Q9Q2_9HYPH|nr:DegQ family serine endoprotease [Dichotomicrobium thermohalophilum]RIA56525.1 Do/DeqQ family serine protease [Dichotomicrobium thermohalophilum]